MSLRLPDYLKHVRDAIARINEYVSDVSDADFQKGGMVADAVIRNFEIIGEACHNIERDSPDFAKTHPGIPLRIAYEMRNALAHGYYKVDLERVWATIQTELPGLHEQIAEALRHEQRRLLDMARDEAHKKFPNNIRSQNHACAEIAESYGLTKNEISALTEKQGISLGR